MKITAEVLDYLVNRKMAIRRRAWGFPAPYMRLIRTNESEEYTIETEIVLLAPSGEPSLFEMRQEELSEDDWYWVDYGVENAIFCNEKLLTQDVW